MKKNIIIPIVAALMSVVFAVGIACGILIIPYKEVWTDTCEVRNTTFIRENRPNGYDNSFDLVRSYDELIELCNLYGNHFAGEDSADCDCKMCVRLRNYDEKFFENKAVIICEVENHNAYSFILENLKVNGQTLALDLTYVEGLYETHGSKSTLFIEVKKSKVERVTNNVKTVRKIPNNNKFSWYKEIFVQEGEEWLERELRKTFRQYLMIYERH